MSEGIKEKITYVRKCQDWLESFEEYMHLSHEVHSSFVTWTGIYILSSALRNKVHIPRKYIGPAIYPNLYIIFVADSGERKSTPINITDQFFDGAPAIARAPTEVSTAALMKQIVDSYDNSITAKSSEFSQFVSKSGEHMYDFLTDLYDGNTRSSLTITRGGELANRPCFNLIAATTPVWMANNMSSASLEGGFASRIVFIFEDELNPKRVFFDEEDQKQLSKIENNLINDLRHISENIEGEFSLSKEVKSYGEDWLLSGKYKTSKDPNLKSFQKRKLTLVLKVAQSIKASHSDELIIELDDFKRSIDLIESVQNKLPRVYQEVNDDPKVNKVNNIISFIHNSENHEAKRRDIYTHFIKTIDPGEIQMTLRNLRIARIITEGSKDRETYYKINLNGKM